MAWLPLQLRWREELEPGGGADGEHKREGKQGEGEDDLEEKRGGGTGCGGCVTHEDSLWGEAGVCCVIFAASLCINLLETGGEWSSTLRGASYKLCVRVVWLGRGRGLT